MDEIKLVFPYSSKTENTIGYAPVMLWTANGWAGIKEFFEDKSLGVCLLSVANRVIAHGKVYLSPEAVRYDINNKPTRRYVEGSQNTGFLYNVRWYDKTYNYNLECASMIYSRDTIDKMIELAKRLDNR